MEGVGLWGKVGYNITLSPIVKAAVNTLKR